MFLKNNAFKTMFLKTMFLKTMLFEPMLKKNNVETKKHYA